jgi:phage baseplate assembly protein W
MDQTYYKGISFNQYQKNKDLLLKNADIVKQDLLNYIFTRKGERVMMPTFGSVIPDLLFEPLDEDTLTIIENEVIDIINYDPRVEPINYEIEPLYDEKAVNIKIQLFYLELNFNDTLSIRLDFFG